MRHETLRSRLEIATAELALAQILLLEAAIESVSMLGERFGPPGRQSLSDRSSGNLAEPFSARFAMFRDAAARSFAPVPVLREGPVFLRKR